MNPLISSGTFSLDSTFKYLFGKPALFVYLRWWFANFLLPYSYKIKDSRTNLQVSFTLEFWRQLSSCSHLQVRLAFGITMMFFGCILSFIYLF